MHLTTNDARTLSRRDRVIVQIDHALRSVFGHSVSARPTPHRAATQALTAEASNTSAQLMRVNHVGEVCAQALYQAQAVVARDPRLATFFDEAAQEERDHLAWTAERLRDLDARVSMLNPLWYAGAFACGVAAGALGDRVSLGFMAETERQVEEHLLGHLDRLPPDDQASRAIVAQMRADEAAHAASAERQGAIAMPGVVRTAMRLAARVMTTTARWV